MDIVYVKTVQWCASLSRITVECKWLNANSSFNNQTVNHYSSFRLTYNDEKFAQATREVVRETVYFVAKTKRKVFQQRANLVYVQRITRSSYSKWYSYLYSCFGAAMIELT